MMDMGYQSPWYIDSKPWRGRFIRTLIIDMMVKRLFYKPFSLRIRLKRYLKGIRILILRFRSKTRLIRSQAITLLFGFMISLSVRSLSPLDLVVFLKKQDLVLVGWGAMMGMVKRIH